MPPNPNPGFVFWGVGSEGGAEGLLSTSLEGSGSGRAAWDISDVRTAVTNVVSLAVFQPQTSNTTDPEKFLNLVFQLK